MRMLRINSFLLITLLFTSCRSYVSDKQLTEKSSRITKPIKVVISGLPTKEQAPDLILSFDDGGNVKFSGSVGVGYSSSGRGYYGHGMPMHHRTDDGQVNRYGNQEQVATPIIYSIEDWCHRRDTELLKQYRPADKGEIIVAVDIVSSVIVSKLPSTTVGVSVGRVKGNTGMSIGGSWAKRDRCHAEIAAEYHFLIDGKGSKKFKATISGSQIKVKNQDAASTVYISAAHLLSREIVYKLLELNEEGFFQTD